MCKSSKTVTLKHTLSRRLLFRGPVKLCVVRAELVKAIWAVLPGGLEGAPPTDDAAWQTAPAACTAGAILCSEWRDGDGEEEEQKEAEEEGQRKGRERTELDMTFWGRMESEG